MKKLIIASLGAFVLGTSLSYGATYQLPLAVSTPSFDTSVLDDTRETVSGVTVRFEIDKNGAVENVEIVNSSGNAVVDTAVVDTVSTWKYVPATDGDGNPIEASKTEYIDLHK